MLDVIREFIGNLQYVATYALLGVVVLACITWMCSPGRRHAIPSRLERNTPPAKAAEVSTPALTKAADDDPAWPTFDTYTPSRQKSQR